MIHVLRGQDDRRDIHGFSMLIPHGKLGFRVRSQHGRLARFADLGQTFEDRVRILDRRGHQCVGLTAGISEHDALIARAIGIDTLRDMRGLFVQQVGDFHRLPVETVLLVSDAFHSFARDLLDPAHDMFRAAHLTADDNAVRGGKGLTCNAREWLLRQKCIDDRIRDLIADLVGMALGYGFRSKGVVLACHVKALRIKLYSPQKQEAAAYEPKTQRAPKAGCHLLR